MHYRKIRADKVFNGLTWFKDGSVLILGDDGVIKDIVVEDRAGEGIEHLPGILVPGLINCHCHLELSHLKNVVPPHMGLIIFLLTVIKRRGIAKEEILEGIAGAENEMYNNGIVAVADICNTDYTVFVKKESKIFWHNLIEVINLHEATLEKQLDQFHSVLQQYKVPGNVPSTATLTPHAPYSVSANAFEALNEATHNSIISIHNQETGAENELFKTGQGSFLELFIALGEQGSPFAVSGKTSLQTWLPYFTKGQTILMVHNTFISEEDILFAKAYCRKYGLDLVYCLCPNANLYIENTLPPVDLLIKHACKIVLGTDSCASNWQLNIVAEIKTLSNHFPKISLETMLQWATSNAAEALGLSTSMGNIEKGKKPGIVLLETDPSNKEAITGKATRIA